MMAANCIKSRSYGIWQIKEYVCDAYADLASILDMTVGSLAYCIADEKTYIYTASSTWAEYQQ